MVTQNISIIFCSLYIFIISIDASKCPEPRKPHVNSCVIFYNCINLPEGGYVWAPEKCPDGLVFQPYLRICVLPGDTWKCDNFATESSPKLDRYESTGSMEPARASYFGYNQDLLPLAVHPSIVEAAYTIDGISEVGNKRRVATPYPLLEIHETEDTVTSDNNKEKSPPTIEHRVENYLYQFFNGHQKNPSSQSTWLNGFMNRILFYEYFGGSSKQEIFSDNQSINRIKSTTCEPNVDKILKKNDFFDNLNSDVLGYIVRSYILGRRQSDGKMKKIKKFKPTTTTEAIEESDEEFVEIPETAGERPSNLIIDGANEENNIVAIKGNLGDKEYITIGKYKSLTRNMPLKVIEILPCAKGIRLSNRTDCTKYYTCDPETALIVKFSCPSKTAFNDYNRVCEAQRFTACVKQSNDLTNLNVHTADESTVLTQTELPATKNPCETTGKFVDPESDRNYYVCFSSISQPNGIDSIMLTCPNDLIFCQTRKLCTTRKRCYV